VWRERKRLRRVGAGSSGDDYVYGGQYVRYGSWKLTLILHGVGICCAYILFRDSHGSSMSGLGC
jgi:hypothetical protein